MSTKPAVLLIPGSFATTGYLIPLRTQIQALGYETYLIPLLTVGARPDPAPTMADDAAFIAAETKKLVDQGKEVVLVSHSYSGVPMSESTKGLTVKERTAAGLKGGIKHLIYTTSIVVPLGGRLLPDDESHIPPPLKMTLDAKLAYFPREIGIGMGHLTFSDVSDPEKIARAQESFQEHAVSSYLAPLTHAGYKDVPCTYFFMTSDQLVVPEVQKACVAVLKENAPSLEVIEFDASHAPQVSRTADFAAVVGKVLEKL